MSWNKKARAIGGLLVIATLLLLLILEAKGEIEPGYERYILLLALIQALLEIDIRRQDGGPDK